VAADTKLTIYDTRSYVNLRVILRIQFSKEVKMNPWASIVLGVGMAMAETSPKRKLRPTYLAWQP